MATHNPKTNIEQLQTILSSPSKKIGFLFGAGISMKDKLNADLIPGVEKMTTLVLSKFTSDPHKTAIGLIKNEIGEKVNIETLLSRISEKELAVGADTLCGLTKSELKSLRIEIETFIKEIVSVHQKVTVSGGASVIEKINVSNLNHFDFSQWIKNADREFPVEIFTTNYDYLLELSLEKLKLKYFDGFIGSCDAFFCPEWIEDDNSVKNWIKLWKLHGSLGWNQNETGEITRTASSLGKAMIYPSFLKYDHSRKQPYLSYMDRLSHFLRQEDSVLIVCGYSFGDDHINSMITTALSRSRSSHVFVLNFGEMEEESYISKIIAKNNSRISVYARRSAVVGCKFGEWRLNSKEVDSLDYFKNDKANSDPNWDGKGEFLLGNFGDFVNFLSNFYAKH